MSQEEVALQLEDLVLEESLSQPCESNLEKSVDLDDYAEVDAAVLPDENSSDEDEFDPEKPNDLKTENQKQREAEEDEEEKEEKDTEEEDDSIVCGDHEIELDCKDHDKCVKAAAKVCDQLLEKFSLKASKKEARVALAEAICDHFQQKE